MKILAVDSCTNVATCAIMVDDSLVAESVICDKVTHSVKLLPQIEHTLKSVDLKPSDIDYFAVTVGPGSFTGQRIGVSTVKALAHATGKKTVAVSTLEALAYNVPYFGGLVIPIMDARREQVYTATYKDLKIVKKDRAIALADLLDEVEENALFLGDGVIPFREKIVNRLGSKAHFALPHLLQLRGGSVAEAAKGYIKNGMVTEYCNLVPSYLRLSQAEREYLERENNK